MVRGMKLFPYFLVFLLCLGAKISNADSGKSVESKRKFISISNKAKDDAVIQCKSGKQNFNKTLKLGEKIRWGLAGETAPAAICHVDLGSEGVHGYLSAFVEKECKRECKWRVLDDGVLKLKVAGGEWKSFELKAEEEAARNSDEHHSCDEDDDDDDDDDVGNSPPGKGKQGSGESRSPEPSTPALAPSSEMTRGAKFAPSPNEGKWEQRNSPKWKSPTPTPMNEKKKSRTRGAKSAAPPTKRIRKAPAPGKWRPRNSRSPAPLASSTKSTASPPAKQINRAQPPTKHGRRKLKPRHPRSPVPVKAPAPKNKKTKSVVPTPKSTFPHTKPIKKSPENAKIAPSPIKHSRSKSISRNSRSRSLASTKSMALPPTKHVKKGRKLKLRNARSPAPEKAPTPKNWKKKPRAPVAKSAPPPTKQIKKWSENAKTAPPPMKHGQGISRPSNYSRSTKSGAPPPTKKAQAPMKQGRPKLKPRHPRSPVPVKAPPPQNKKTKPVAFVPKSTLPPMKYSQEKSRPRNSRSPAPELPASTISRAPPPTKQIKKAQPPTKQGRRKLKHRHPRSQEPVQAPIAISTNQITKPSENAKTAPIPTTNGKSGHGNFPKWKASAPADWKTKSAPSPENGKRASRAPGAKLAPPPRNLKPGSAPPTEGGEECEGPDAELPPLPRPGSTFYTCIKEDSR